ncbi:S24/S26 family peptidase [Actinotalea ferrariae]|uniref:S24/S26 family peptidase n=1 Tax=Actinotalea ferrariae TaxID=1386098 RepID=UPI001C8B26E4|nr:S24/S26 family peptidase [Actinotalea ferrariae]MBX9247092.1 S24/S26 family peptidase [Actinotalea ferrariae]
MTTTTSDTGSVSTTSGPAVPPGPSGAGGTDEDDGGPEGRTARGRVLRLAAWLPALLAGLLVVGLWPSSWGGCTTVVVVSGGSMEPTYAPGDLLVARCGETAVGDVVVYAPPSVPDARVVHRVVGGDAAGWELRGDANDWLDPWQPDDRHVLGRVVAHVPGHGLAPLLLSPLLWLSLVVVAGGLLVWPGSGRGDDDTEATGAGEAAASTASPSLAPRGSRTRRAAVSAASGMALLALAAVPLPADAARTDVAAGDVLAWTGPADVAPPRPAASCTTADPDLPCTAEVRLIHDWGHGYDVELVVRDARTSTSGAMTPWTVVLDLSAPPFPWVPDVVDAEGLVLGSTCADLPVMVVTGTTGWGDHHLLGPGASRSMWLQAHPDALAGDLLVCR